MSKGIIICTSSNLYQVKVENEIYNCSARGKFKAEKITPLVGDHVEIQITDKEKKEGIIERIYERKNELKRPKIANITQLIFVVSMKMPKPDLLLLDKQLAFANYLGIKSVIILNKTDLERQKKIDEIEQIYKNIGYKVIQTNLKQPIPLETMETLLKNNITVLAGNSGVGKSTLLNSIFNKKITEEGIVSEKNKRGKNTTTSVTLFEYDDNSFVADTPGFSTFEITEISKEDLSHYLIEFNQYMHNCEFLGCSHIKEQQCGIKEAVEEGKISTLRYENYKKIYEELKTKEETKW